ncbi:MAG: hypothetical protein HW421_3466 [Ignavibacteria bacterium]|nr:hypothetical protein [Ignavibacteria bacterium]
MSTFEKIIGIFTYAAIGIAIIEVYFKINKIWKRKHEKQVAESQSIVGLGMASLVLIVWMCNFIIKGDYEAIADNVVYLGEAAIYIVIGSGFFVAEKRKTQKGFWNMIKDALRVERKEASYLLKSITGKGQAEKIIKILHNIAWIDNDFDVKERDMIKDFAGLWGIKINDTEFNTNPHKESEERLVRYERVISSLKDYLEEKPTRDHSLQVKKLLYDIINADGVIEQEEDIIIGQLDGIILTYLNEPVPKFSVLVVPQNENHREIIETILKSVNPDMILSEKERYIDGGTGFVVSECYSQSFADIVAEEQRKTHNIMTVVKKEIVEIKTEDREEL